MPPGQLSLLSPCLIRVHFLAIAKTLGKVFAHYKSIKPVYVEIRGGNASTMKLVSATVRKFSVRQRGTLMLNWLKVMLIAKISASALQ